jgi:hypothetical protein
VNTVESSHINTPVVGEVLRDVYQNGHLIVPAGAVVSSFAQSGAVRDRIEVAGMWLIVYPDATGKPTRAISNSGLKMGALDFKGSWLSPITGPTPKHLSRF